MTESEAGSSGSSTIPESSRRLTSRPATATRARKLSHPHPWKPLSPDSDPLQKAPLQEAEVQSRKRATSRTREPAAITSSSIENRSASFFRSTRSGPLMVRVPQVQVVGATRLRDSQHILRPDGSLHK